MDSPLAGQVLAGPLKVSSLPLAVAGGAWEGSWEGLEMWPLSLLVVRRGA